MAVNMSLPSRTP